MKVEPSYKYKLFSFYGNAGAPQALLQSCVTFGLFSFVIEGLNKQQTALAQPQAQFRPLSTRNEGSSHNALSPLSLPLAKELNEAFSIFYKSLRKPNKGSASST